MFLPFGFCTNHTYVSSYAKVFSSTKHFLDWFRNIYINTIESKEINLELSVSLFERVKK